MSDHSGKAILGMALPLCAIFILHIPFQGAGSLRSFHGSAIEVLYDFTQYLISACLQTHTVRAKLLYLTFQLFIILSSLLLAWCYHNESWRYWWDWTGSFLYKIFLRSFSKMEFCHCHYTTAILFYNVQTLIIIKQAHSVFVQCKVCVFHW